MNTQKNLIEKIIFIHDSNCKSGYIKFKFDITKEYIKQFLLSFSPPDFSKFVHESIKGKIKTVPTSSVIWTQDKYLHAPNSTAAFAYLKKIYTPIAMLQHVQSLPIFIRVICLWGQINHLSEVLARLVFRSLWLKWLKN